MPIDALRIGPAQKYKTDQQPAERPTAILTISANLRSALVIAASMIAPSAVAADKSENAVVSIISREERLEKLDSDLRQAWSTLADHLAKQNDVLDQTFVSIKETLWRDQFYARLHRFNDQCSQKEQAYYNGDDGREFKTVEGQLRLQMETRELLDSFMDSIPANAERAMHIVQQENDELASADTARRSLEEAYRHELMTDEAGKRLRLFPEECADDPTLTVDAYLDLLAKRLKSPKDLAMFVRLFFVYAIDTDNIHQPLKKGTWSTASDYWQTPAETLQRVEDGKILGDCDDLTLLCDALLTRMGEHPVTIYLPGKYDAHVTTLWMKKVANRFVVHEIGTDGWFENGIQRVKADFQTGLEPDIPEPPAGHDSEERAIMAALERYRPTNLFINEFEVGMPRIRLPIAQWKPDGAVHSRLISVPMREFITMLSPHSELGPMITAGTAPPPPPPE